MSEKEKKKIHPNSLANLGYAWNSETAKEAQLKGAAARKANRIARDQLKLSLTAWNALRKEVNEDFSSVELLRIIAMQKLDEGDVDGGVEILKSIAEFEKPKLQRVEQKVEDITTDQLSDEELEKLLEEATKNPKSQ